MIEDLAPEEVSGVDGVPLSSSSTLYSADTVSVDSVSMTLLVDLSAKFACQSHIPFIEGPEESVSEL
jgi:hypothetical protein